MAQFKKYAPKYKWIDIIDPLPPLPDHVLEAHAKSLTDKIVASMLNAPMNTFGWLHGYSTACAAVPCPGMTHDPSRFWESLDLVESPDMILALMVLQTRMFKLNRGN